MATLMVFSTPTRRIAAERAHWDRVWESAQRLPSVREYEASFEHPNLTDWFLADLQPPEREGVYEVLHPNGLGVAGPGRGRGFAKYVPGKGWYCSSWVFRSSHPSKNAGPWYLGREVLTAIRGASASRFTGGYAARPGVRWRGLRSQL